MLKPCRGKDWMLHYASKRAMSNNSKHTFAVLAYKESPFLEDCVKSVMNQQYKSNVVIATSTPNRFIDGIAKKYGIKVIARPKNDRGKGAASDFDFALSVSDTTLTTVANHDEIYDYNYSSEIVSYYEKHKDSCIIFTRAYDIKGNLAVTKSLNLIIKNMLCWPLAFSQKSRFTKRLLLAFGDPICCPAATFVKGHYEFPVFESGLIATFDYWAWEKLSKSTYSFGYIKKPLMGHRIHEGSITTKAIGDNVRAKEEYMILSKFWPKPIAKIISSVYRLSERSNG